MQLTPRASRSPTRLQILLLGVLVLVITGGYVGQRSIQRLRAIEEAAVGGTGVATNSLRREPAQHESWQLAAARLPQTRSALRELFHQRLSVLNKDQQLVINMTQHAWRAYREHGDWRDHLDPNLGHGADLYGHSMAYTAVDALDTLLIMGLHEEFDEASAWIRANLHRVMFQSGSVSFFETTIRSLGGLLSAHYFSGEAHLLELATSLGDALSRSFTCGNNLVPCQYTDLEDGSSRGRASLAEANSFQLEFLYLARLTNSSHYLDRVNNVNELMDTMNRKYYKDGLVPVEINWDAKRAEESSDISAGTHGDSYYEYLLKQWLLTGKKDDAMKQRYLTAIDGMKSKLLGYSHPSNLAFLGTLTAEGKLIAKMEHLTCFIPGMLAVGAHHGLPADHLSLAKELMETCMQMYSRSASKLSPEIVHLATKTEPADDEMWAPNGADYNILRPEVIESLTMLYRVTKDEKYRAYGRDILVALEKHCRLPVYGYRSMKQVFRGPLIVDPHAMESFFISETLKYLFLLFSDDDIVPIDAMVFTTEAHPLPIAL